MPRIAIATFSDMPPEFTDDERLAAALTDLGADVEPRSWDDATADWDSFDLVVIRSTWNYSERREEFVAWAESIGERLHNSPAVVRWNSDKHYLDDLAAAGLAVVPTTYVAPGEALPDLDGIGSEVVVKPTVSAGGRHTGRFSEATWDGARGLASAIHASGRTVMLQPYLREVDTVGETAVVCVAGQPSHVLHKKAVLRPDEMAPMRDDGAGAAEAMYDPDLVGRSDATEAELTLARDVVNWMTERFGQVPLYARVDMVPGGNGAPILMELEAIEPNLYLEHADGAAERVARAILELV